MKTYDELRSICKRTGRVMDRVVDDFLIYHAAGHHGLEKKMKQQFARYSHVGDKLGKKAVNMFKSQYLAHRVFRKGGLIGKFLQHSALDRFQGEERDYLLQQHKLPWRFSFSVIVDNPAKDFYTMEDVFTGKRYQLYSPTMTGIRNDANPLLWFNLTGFNGYCWQSYGPVVYFNSFEAGDIYFFATELSPDIDEPEKVAAHVELDPVPYMMLISGATHPVTFHKEDRMRYLLAEHDLERLDTSALKRDFITEYDSGVYRINHKRWGEHPHFAEAYFDEEKQLLLFTAMTDRGFAALVKAFNAHGHVFPAEPYLRVDISMVATAGKIFKRKVVLNEYHELFQVDPDPEGEKLVEKVNAFMALVMPDINAGRTPDIEAAARKTGVDPGDARGLVESVMGKLDNLPAPQKVKPTPKATPPGKSVASGKISAPKKRPASKKPAAVLEQLPPQPREGVRLLSKEDELLFDLRLYLMAGDLKRLAPWEYMYESEVFGVQVPGTDRVWFVSVMGSEGEFEALSFYKGYEGLAAFVDIRAETERLSRMGLHPENMMPAALMGGGTMTIPHLMLSFADREELEKEDLSAIKRSGMRFRGRGVWPRIEEIVPGYMPVYPERETLVELFLVMQQALVVLERAEKDLRYLMREDDPENTYMVRVPTGKGYRFRWKYQYLQADLHWGGVQYAARYSADTFALFSRLPKTSQELQLDLFMLPAPVKERGRKGYFPFVLMMIDKQSGMVGTAMLTPQPDLKSMYESIPQRVLEELMKSGYRPSKIEIRSDLLQGLLKETLKEAGCSVVWVNQMPQMDEVIGSLISNLS